MRVLLAAGITATSVLVVSSGCSNMRMPSFPSFGLKGKSSKSDAALTNAPPAPQFNSMAAGGANESTPPATSWSNLPVYPGTNYPQTPYPEQAMVSGPAAQAYPSYPPTGGAAPAVDPAASAYAQGYGAMPPAASNGPANPYAPHDAAGAQAPSYAAAPTYPQQAAPYAQQPSPYPQQPAPGYTQQAPAYGQPPSYAQQPAPGYAQQPAPGYAQQAPYTESPAPPYSPQQAPYGATSEPYNAANPYGTYTR